MTDIKDTVRALRHCGNNECCTGCTRLRIGPGEIIPCMASLIRDALSIIESQSAENDSLRTANKALESDVYNNELNLSILNAKLEGAQRRERAAVEDMQMLAIKDRHMPCAVCKHEKLPVLVEGKLDMSCPCVRCREIDSSFEWRGPEAGKGE